MSKKIISIISLLLLAITNTSFAAYEEIECSTDPVFSENSCNQCFTGGDKLQGDNLGLLTDLWMNVTDVSKLLYKEEQVDPEMLNLDSSNVTWTETPNSESFWEYTPEFDALYSDLEEGYILEAGKSVTWIKSSLSHAYNLEKNTAEKGENIGMLVYPITSHNILDDGEITIDNTEHKECVLFTSGESAEEIIVEEEKPKKLPETGPAESILLVLLAMILSFGILKVRARS